MSGPNTQYDPVEVAALDPAALDAAVREATAAFAAATTLDELKAARITHVDRGAVALAKREIGALPPERQGGGRQAGGRGAGRARPRAREPPGRARGGARPADPRRGGRRRHPAGVPPPARRAAPAGADPGTAHGRLRRHGLGGRRGSRGRVGVDELRRPQPRQGPPGPPDAGHLLRRPGRRWSRPAHPDLAGADPDHAGADPADLRRLPGQGVPDRRPRRDAYPGLPPDRGAGGRQGPDHGAPARGASTTSST